MSVHSPISVIWHACRVEILSWLWSRCRRWKRRPMWKSRPRTGTGRTFCLRCCCRWSATWTCSRNSDPPHPSATSGPAHLPSAKKHTKFAFENIANEHPKIILTQFKTELADFTDLAVFNKYTGWNSQNTRNNQCNHVTHLNLLKIRNPQITWMIIT